MFFLKNLIIRPIGWVNRLFYMSFRMFVGLIPRNRNLIVYGGALDLFIDNAKHLFIYNLSENKLSNYRHVWLTRNESTYLRIKSIGYPVIKSNSIHGIFCQIRAGFVIFDNEISEFGCYNLTEGATRIELWHGLPLKFWGCVSFENQPAYIPKSLFIEKFVNIHPHGDYTICTHDNQKQFFSAAFKIPIEKVILATYPRLRTFFMSSDERLAYLNKFETRKFVEFYKSLEQQNKKIIYMPTFRDSNPDYIKTAIPDWEQLNEICKINDIILYLKVHRVTPLPNIHQLSNIRILDNEIDVYPILPLIDMLITDYSSIMYDFALLKKPVALYTYDIDEYSSNSRKITKKFKQLREQITHVDTFVDFLKLFNTDVTSIKRFPIDDYYKTPYDFDSINRLIITLSA